MNVSSFVFEQVLKRLQIPSHAIGQLRIAGRLSDVDGTGFPADLFQLSAPMVTRGLLNFATFQMKKDWLYPHWVYKQLDPGSESFIARSQNPLFLNITHRNWTLLGSPTGYHEAIVDPRGLVTPLPREWSIDCWLGTEEGLFLPSFHEPIKQELDVSAPRITTIFDFHGVQFELDAFVDSTNHAVDILFHRVSVINQKSTVSDASIFVAIRPFNPEGAAPIHRIEYRPRRQIYVDRCVGLVFAEEPQWVACSNSYEGDTVNLVRRMQSGGSQKDPENRSRRSVACEYGLANAVAAFPLSLQPGERRSVHCSVALATKSALGKLRAKSTWRVSFEKRRERQQMHWAKERSFGAAVGLGDEHLQKLFDANVLTLLQLHDGPFISPGPYLYHRFWFRDAVPMAHALDRLGFHRRVRQVIDGFAERQTSDGFFRGPDGEWDSNGAVLWLFKKHIELTHSALWMKHAFPFILRAAEWIIKKRKQSLETQTTHRGLMPPGLSAEHLGTVDQYYWDSFWSLAGIDSASALARDLGRLEKSRSLDQESQKFRRDIQSSLDKAASRIGRRLIPASPSRLFDESAIGSICGIYPLQFRDLDPEAFRNTLKELTSNYVNEKGFYHPIIHSGYNPYLTMQLAHSYLFEGKSDEAWKIANTILRQCTPPYSLPEAIHPRTGGGAMGDGHHGWAAAEIILFLLDCLVREDGDTLHVFKDAHPDTVKWGTNISVQGIATSFGKASCSLNYETGERVLCSLALEPVSDKKPASVEIHLPFFIRRTMAITQGVDVCTKAAVGKIRIRCSSGNAMMLLEK
jgi:hypothetical protein